MAITIAACIAGRDTDAIHRLPQVTDDPPEVIVHRGTAQWLRPGGAPDRAQMVEIGDATGTRRAELETALSPRTVVCAVFRGRAFRGPVRCRSRTSSTVAHAHGVRVFVDAAAQIPPIANLWRFTRELGADAAIFSGGKGLRGPQSSGLVLG